LTYQFIVVDFSHQLGMSIFRGEGEALVNFVIVYVQSQIFDIDLDEAVVNSLNGGDILNISATATTWMVTPEFRLGKEMDHSEFETNQMRYQVNCYGL
jgi:hypothetical protein